MPNKSLSFKSAFDELQLISSRIKGDEVTIEELPQTIQRAKFLVNYCQELLKKVELELSDNAEKTEETN